MSVTSTSGIDSSEQDRQILQHLARGETDPITELYDRYGQLVFSLIVRIVGDSAIAEDLVQEVFVRVWHSASSYRPESGTVRAWLLAIAHHRAVDEWRRHRREQGWLSLDDTTTEWLAIQEDQVSDPFVNRAMAELPGEQRQVVELAYFHGFTLAEIASQLNLAPGTVKSRIRLAMTKLRLRLAAPEGRQP